MKKIIYSILILFVFFSLNACVKNDNYDPPTETLTGEVIDVTTGKPIQTESGGGGIQIRYHDLTWGETTGNPVIPRDFNVMHDGTFNNTKFFAGKYKIYPFNGAFVPLYSENAAAPIDNSKIVNVKGVTKVDFQVEPFLKIDWVSEPVFNPANNTITASFKFTRGTTNPAFIFSVTDAWIFVSTTAFVSNASRISNISNSVTYTGTAGDQLLGQTVTLTSKTGYTLNSHETYYVRIGARTADNIQKRYNYSTVKTVVIP